MKQDRRILKSAAAGAVAGLVAAAVMGPLHKALAKAATKVTKEEGEQQSGEQQGDDATVKAAKAISRNVFGTELPERHKKWAGPAVHFGLGALLGATYGVLAEAYPISRSGWGSAYGTAVWLGADEIAVPKLGLAKPLEETPIGSQLAALGAHLVYGATTDVVRGALMRI